MKALKPYFLTLASYLANFLSNLAVVGIGVAIFTQDKANASLLAALLSLTLGVIMMVLVKKGEQK